MSDVSLRIKNFFHELKRRKVFRVALMYGVVAWLLIQIAETTFPALQFPEWTIRFVIVAALFGFPIALLLSWAYELRPEEPAPVRLATPPGSDTATAPAPNQADRAIEEAPAPLLAPAYRLPNPPTRFVGRERELAEIQRLIAEPTCRLVTICGPGGVGKTRFALQAATAAAETFPQGAAFVPLNALTDSKPLVSTIAECVGLPLSGRGDPKLELLAYLREKQMLLVMDNFEHLTESSALLSEMLEAAPNLKLLVTSRERLGLYGESLFPLEGLGLPAIERGTEDLQRSEAVHLFLQSARRVHPHFSPDAAGMQTIAQICRAVDGLPLAIELAAAWVRALTCEQILREIQHDHDFLADSFRDVPERHRSIRSIFESSWRLLSDAERKAFRRLAVFHGGFEAEAGAEVASASVPMLLALLDKSLLRRSSSGRFEVLEVLRQYAEDKLREDADEFAWVNQHHCRYYADLLGTLSAHLETGGETAALDRIAAEIQNVREAWQWAVDHRLVDPLDRAMHCVFVFHEGRGRAREGCELFQDAVAALAGPLDLSEAEQFTAVRVQVRQAVFSAQLGQSAEAGEQLNAAISRLREINRPRELAFALDRRGVIAFDLGMYAQTNEFCAESLAIARTAGDQRQAGWALMHLGNAAFAMGNYEDSERLHRKSLAKLEAVGDRRGIANCHRNLGIVAGTQGQHAEAQHSFQLALSINREIGNLQGVSGSLQNLGTIAWLAGKHRQAEVYLQEAVSLSRDMGIRKTLTACLNTLGNVAVAQQDYAGARQYYHQALTTAADNNDTPFMLEILIGTARLLGRHEGRPEQARELAMLVLDNPASDHFTRNSAEELLAELDILLPEAQRRQRPGCEPRLPLDAAVAGILSDGVTLAAHRDAR